jgi:hypothetical protein
LAAASAKLSSLILIPVGHFLSLLAFIPIDCLLPFHQYHFLPLALCSSQGPA